MAKKITIEVTTLADFVTATNEVDFKSKKDAMDLYFEILNSKVQFIKFSSSMIINKDTIVRISIKE